MTKTPEPELTHLKKIFWPKEGYTKGDVIAYYDKIAPYILPYLKDRPESLNRHPDGIEGESFYHKDILDHSDWVKTVPIPSDSVKKTVHWLICDDRNTLLYMANLGCIEINPWNSRFRHKTHPDYMILDLDPEAVGFEQVIKTALEIKKLLDAIGANAFIKTSGKRGLHILMPLGAKYTFDQARQLAEILANTVAAKLPKTTSIVRDPDKRQKRVYIDFLQNRVGQTLTAPYSLRPVPGANVSTPLEWKELKTGLKPSDFNIKTIFPRLESKGDVWKGFLSHPGIDMAKVLDRLEKLTPQKSVRD